jgi:hypothetical protein
VKPTEAPNALAATGFLVSSERYVEGVVVRSSEADPIVFNPKTYDRSVSAEVTLCEVGLTCIPLYLDVDATLGPRAALNRVNRIDDGFEQWQQRPRWGQGFGF